jgi:riboflavin kinase/FMN adenylyltransferase
VRTGSGIGRRQVVPTLNLAAEEELLPKMGVYATETWIALRPGEGTAIGLPTHPADRPSRVYRSVTNIGVRPTFTGVTPVILSGAKDLSVGPPRELLSIESHLFDFSAELHTGWLVVQFWVRLRDEIKFSGADALREQIQRDIESARKFFRRLDHAREVVRSHPRLPWTKGHAPEPF